MLQAALVRWNMRLRAWPRWQRTLAAVSVAQLISMLAFMAYMSFIPYYVQEMGALDEAQTIYWTSLFASSAAIAMAISSPKCRFRTACRNH